MIEKKEFENRRRYLLNQIGEGGIGVVFSAPESLRNINIPYHYRQNSDFYYLTGFNEPESAAVFIPGRKEGEYLIFNRKYDPVQEIWVGRRAGQEGACNDYGAEQAFPIGEINEIMPTLMANKRILYFGMERDFKFDLRLAQWLAVTHKVREGVNIPREFVNIGKILHEMRLYKSNAEIAVIRKAAEISQLAYLRMLRTCHPGMFEYELEAELLYEFIKNGGRYQAFETIVGGGANGCVLHYVDNDEELVDGELVLVDSGIEYECYSTDVTRTFPINGRFNNEQKAVYQAVLDVQLAVINEIRPGVKWDYLELTAERMVTRKLMELQLLQGSFEDLLEKKFFRTFYMHHIGHWLGLDNKDPSLYKLGGDWRVLQPGMVFTVEPGIYISRSDAVDKKWWNIGVRIEDNVLVTESGCEVLTKKIPKTVDEIEKNMLK